MSARMMVRGAIPLLLLATACADDAQINAARVGTRPPPPPGAVGPLRTAAMENRIAVSWRPPSGTVTQYETEACRDGLCDTTLVVDDTTEATVRLWEFYEWFGVRVRAGNLLPQGRSSPAVGGYGPWSPEITTRTSRQGVVLAETVWLYDDVITSADSSVFDSASYIGRDTRDGFWDVIARRWTTVDSLYLFSASYGGYEIEYQLHPEYGSIDSARVHVDKYAPVIGHLPHDLLVAAREVEISPGNLRQGGLSAGPCGGSHHIYTRNARPLDEDLHLEEALLHEAGHLLTSHCQGHETSDGWLAAQAADGIFPTEYARLNPRSEDTAEAIWAWFVARCVPERAHDAVVRTIEERLPNRLAYFDRLGLDMAPFRCRSVNPAIN